MKTLIDYINEYKSLQVQHKDLNEVLVNASDCESALEVGEELTRLETQQNIIVEDATRIFNITYTEMYDLIDNK